MIYARVSTAFLLEPKRLAVGPEASLLYVLGILYAKEQMTDGFVPDEALMVIGAGMKRPRFLAEKLVKIGLWEKVPGGFSVGSAKWAKHQTTREEVEKRREKDRERKRPQVQKGDNSARNPRGTVAESERNPDGIRSESLAYKPEPEPEPEPEVVTEPLANARGSGARALPQAPEAPPGPAARAPSEPFDSVKVCLAEVARLTGTDPPLDAEVRRHLAAKDPCRLTVEKLGPLKAAAVYVDASQRAKGVVTWGTVWASNAGLVAALEARDPKAHVQRVAANLAAEGFSG